MGRNTRFILMGLYDLSFLKFSGELGDYDPEIHEGNYISEHKLLKTQTSTIEEKAMELHKTQLKGFTPEQAENYFLRIASQLDTYAVDPHPVKVIFVILARPPCNNEGIMLKDSFNSEIRSLIHFHFHTFQLAYLQITD